MLKWCRPFFEAFGDDWLDDAHLGAYASAFAPRVYDDFFATAKQHMTHETRAKVRRMLAFEFERRASAGFGKGCLRMIERQVRTRAQLLLD